MVKWNEMSLQETLEYMSKLDSGAPNSQNYFADVAMHDSHRPLQMLAVTKLTDQALLAKVASYHTDYEIYRIALQKISDPALISEVARNAWDIYACLLAVRKM
ncbi:MAG TPA: hypothetical protein DCY75_05090, partial [Clostridiales bacterium]|nr:hypothetical protein [Clostridiales bacterium]